MRGAVRAGLGSQSANSLPLWLSALYSVFLRCREFWLCWCLWCFPKFLVDTGFVDWSSLGARELLSVSITPALGGNTHPAQYSPSQAWQDSLSLGQWLTQPQCTKQSKISDPIILLIN